MVISSDKEKIEHLLTRRVVDAVVAVSLRKKLLAGKPLRVKFGADPTSPDLHLGHAVALRKLREFQDLGHTVVFIVGDYTARIGDPSGKSKTRPTLSDDEVKKNAETYLAQVGRILDLKKTEVRRNGEWFGKMGFDDILRLTSQFTVARMIERDDFAKRMKEGTDVHMHELLYPMMQAYDSVMVEADVELGGTDQRFNILAGRDLQRKMGKPEQDCLFVGPILVGTDGTQKMSKSLGNYVGLSDAPEDMFGKVMSIPDAALWDWWTLTTDESEAKIAAMRTACDKKEMNPRDAKANLAKAIISLYHSAQAAEEAEAKFAKVFREKEVPDDIPEVAGAEFGEHSILNLLVFIKAKAPSNEWNQSKNKWRQLLEQGGIKVNGKVITDPEAKVVVTNKPLLIQKGKRHFVKIIAA